jgi:hypothetical protein
VCWWASRASGFLSRRIQELMGGTDGFDPSWKLSDTRTDSWRWPMGGGRRCSVFVVAFIVTLKAVDSGFKVLDVCVLCINSSGQHG